MMLIKKKAKGRKQKKLLSYLRTCRLCWQITAGIFVAFFLFQIILFFPFYAQYKHELLLDLQKRGVLIISSLLQVYPPEKNLKEFKNIGSKVTEVSILKGAIIYNQQKKIITKIGEKSALTLYQLYHIQLGMLPKLMKDHNRTYVFWNSERLKQPYVVLAVLDTSALKTVLKDFLKGYIFGAFVFLLYLAIIVMVVIGFMVLLPILRLRKNLIESLHAKVGRHKSFLISPSRNELHDVNNIADELLNKINHYIAKINKQQEQLKQLNLSLEDKVNERTQSLIEANKQLKKEVNERIIAQQQSYEMALFPQENTNPVMRISMNGVLLYANRKAKIVLDFWKIQLNKKVPEKWQRLVETTLSLNERKEIEEMFGDNCFLIVLTPIKDRNYVNLYFTNINKRKEYEKQIMELNTLEPITKLANRYMFETISERVVLNAKAKNKIFAVMMIEFQDIHAIKHIKGRHGEEILLKIIAGMLKELLPETFVLAKFSDDIFAVTTSTLEDTEKATQIAEKIIFAFKEIITIGNINVSLSTNIGISIFPDDGESIDLLIKNAEVALLNSKVMGKDQSKFFVDAMNLQVAKKQLMLSALQKALANQEFIMLFQPQHELLENKLVGAEVLLRWNSKQFGLISPSEFIPLLEESGLIVKVTEWILLAACQQLKELSKYSSHEIGFSINITANQFLSAGFVEVVNSIINKTRINPNNLILEITERVALTDAKLAMEQMQKLELLGIKIAIDDFGTEYSSLRYLQKFAMDYVKIDKSFIDGINKNQESESIILMIIQLAKTLNMKTIAEGVETPQQYQFLKLHGCDEIQGNYFSKPLDKADFVAYIKRLG